MAAVFTGERELKSLNALSKEAAIKEFTPILKDSPDSGSFVVAAFVLAMKGVDVDANLARLVMPIKNSHDDMYEELKATRGLAENQILIEDIPNAIYTIYKTRKYGPALKTLLTMPVAWPAAEYRDDCVMAQLRLDPKSLLGFASSDAKVYATLWDIIDWNIGPIQDRMRLAKVLKTSAWSTPAMKKTALRLAHDIATPKNRPIGV